MVQPDFITTAEVAKLLKISLSTVTRMAREGRLSAIKVGKLWRFPAASPDILLYKQQQGARRAGEAGKSGEAGKDARAKNGLREFVRLAVDVGILEPWERAALYGRKP